MSMSILFKKVETGFGPYARLKGPLPWCARVGMGPRNGEVVVRGRKEGNNSLTATLNIVPGDSSFRDIPLRR